MFGLILPGFPPQTLLQIGPDKWALTFQLPLSSDRAVVFLTGQAPLPPTHGAAVYVSRANETGFEYLGYLTPEIPSAIFVIPPLLIDNLRPNALCIGVSLEAADTLKNLEGQGRLQKEFYLTGKAELAKQIGLDLYQFMQSFVQEDPVTRTSYLMVPVNVLDKWMQRLVTKIKLDAKFLGG